jgi:hypothetical protein
VTPNDTERAPPRGRVTSAGASAKAANEIGSAAARSVQPPGAAGEGDGEDDVESEAKGDRDGEGDAMAEAAGTAVAVFPAGSRLVLMGPHCPLARRKFTGCWNSNAVLVPSALAYTVRLAVASAGRAWLVLGL